MSAYYPSQAGYPASQPMVGQPVVYPTSGYGSYGVPVAGSYAQPGGVMYVPSYSSGRRHSHRRRRHYGDYRVPPVQMVGTAPVMVQPSYANYPQHHHGYYNPHSFGSRLRRFFGLAPSNGYTYKSDYGTWGFMGFSRRQRYMDPRTGAEVDRKGRPVIRV